MRYASEWTRESVIFLLLVAVACAKTDANATPSAPAKQDPTVATSAAGAARPSVCVLIPKANMESLTHVIFAAIEDETPPREMYSICRYLVSEDLPMERVELRVDWYADISRARSIMPVASTPGDIEMVPGLGDEAWFYADQLTVRKGSIVIGLLSRLPATEGKPLPPSSKTVLESEKTIAEAVLAKL